jgi:hypothetical protein
MALSQSNGVQSSANVSTQAVTLSVAPALNDLIVIAVAQGSNGNGSFTCPGFSAITGLSVQTMPTTGTYFYALYKVAGGSEPTSYTVTPNAGNWCAVQIWDFTGRNSAAPITAASANTIAQGSPPINIAVTGVTAVSGDDLLWFGALGNTGVSESFTVPSGFTNALNTSGATSGFQVSLAGCVQQNVASGATGTLTGSMTGSGASDAAGAIISIAKSVVPPSIPLLGQILM